jgi:pyrroline-5-carboxylate reductase
MIRKHLVDKLGTSMEIKERNIELHALVSASETAYGFTATFTITDATQA